MNSQSFMEMVSGRQLVRSQKELDAAFAARKKLKVPSSIRDQKGLNEWLRDHRWPLKVDIRSGPKAEIDVGPDVEFHAYGRSRVALFGEEDSNFGSFFWRLNGRVDGVADDSSVVRVFKGCVSVVCGCATRVDAFGRSFVLIGTHLRNRTRGRGHPLVTFHDRATAESENSVSWEKDMASHDVKDLQDRGEFAVRAFDRSQVKLCGLDHMDDRRRFWWISCKVDAFDCSRVRSFGYAVVSACGSARVHAHDDSVVSARGSCVVEAYDCSRVSVSESAVLKDHRRDPAEVRAMNLAKSRAARDAKITGRVKRAEKAVEIAQRKLSLAKGYRDLSRRSRPLVTGWRRVTNAS